MTPNTCSAYHPEQLFEEAMDVARKALVVAMIVAALFAPGIAKVGARQAHAPTRRLVHVVQPGDTLWRIAGEVAPGQDVVGTVDALIRANHLSGANLRPGQPLFLAGS